MDKEKWKNLIQELNKYEDILTKINKLTKNDFYEVIFRDMNYEEDLCIKPLEMIYLTISNKDELIDLKDIVNKLIKTTKEEMNDIISPIRKKKINEQIANKLKEVQIEKETITINKNLYNLI